MIEVEKKVALKEGDLKAIERLGTFLGSKMITDTYFDTPNFRYTTSDIWLRERVCKYELKIGVKNLGGDLDRYEEITDEGQILKKLGLEREKEFSKALEKGQIFPFATFQTIRRKYQIEEFMIDLDLAYYDDFIYRLAQVELLVGSEDKVDAAKVAICEFMEKLGIDYKQPIKAKLIEYLNQKNPTHYQALVSSGVIPQVS